MKLLNRTFFPTLFLVTLILSASVSAQLSAGNRQAVSVDQNGKISSVRPRGEARGSVVKAEYAVSDDIRRIERAVFDLMNAERSAKGLTGLKWSDDVARAARQHSSNMAAEKFFSHRGKDGKMVDDRADLFGIRWASIGENIAFMKGFSEPEKKAIKTWMDSPPHRRNLLGQQWTESAIGVAQGEDGSYYFTQVFISR